jgi:hypothetical protein
MAATILCDNGSSVASEQAKTCICRLCKREFTANHRRKYCNLVCKLSAQRASYGQAKCVACGLLFWKADAAQSTCNRFCAAKARCIEVAGTCDCCGKQFTRSVQENIAKSVRFCSVRCYEVGVVHAKNHRRRCQIQQTAVAGDIITVHALWQRDKGKCHICRKKVDLSIKGRTSLAPSVDHLLALSKGGAHTWENVALAHFGCNARKCAKGGTQLRLIG